MIKDIKISYWNFISSLEAVNIYKNAAALALKEKE